MKPESMLRRLFAALSHRNYRFYWLGQLSSVLALNMEMAAQAWLVFLLTDSPLMLGVAGIVYAVPRVSLVLVGGAIADRADKRRIMVLTQSLLALAYLVLGLLVLTERVEFWHVLVFAFNSGFLRAFDRPSRYALLPEMVPREELANAVALGSSVWQACRLLGPGLAGVLIYWLGIGPTFLACFASSVAAVVLWAFIRTRAIVGQPQGGVWRNIAAGLDFVRRNQLFYSLLGLTFFNSVFGMSYVILLPVFARSILRVGSRGFGLLQSVSGVGALLGTLTVALSGPGRTQGLAGAGGVGGFRGAAHDVRVFVVVPVVAGPHLPSRTLQPDLSDLHQHHPPTEPSQRTARPGAGAVRPHLGSHAAGRRGRGSGGRVCRSPRGGGPGRVSGGDDGLLRAWRGCPPCGRSNSRERGDPFTSGGR